MFTFNSCQLVATVAEWSERRRCVGHQRAASNDVRLRSKRKRRQNDNHQPQGAVSTAAAATSAAVVRVLVRGYKWHFAPGRLRLRFVRFLFNFVNRLFNAAHRLMI